MGEYIQKWSVKNENRFFKSGYWHEFWNSRYGMKILDFSENSGDWLPNICMFLTSKVTLFDLYLVGLCVHNLKKRISQMISVFY